MPRSVPRRRLKETLHCATSGFKPVPLELARGRRSGRRSRARPRSARRDQEAPAAERARTSRADRSPARERIDARPSRLLMFRDLRDRHHELPPQSGCRRHLLHDLVLQVPGQDEDVVRPGLRDPVGGEDRDVRARQELPLLVRVAVDRVVEEVRPDAAVVEQRVALARARRSPRPSCRAAWRGSGRRAARA